MYNKFQKLDFRLPHGMFNGLREGQASFLMHIIYFT